MRIFGKTNFSRGPIRLSGNSLSSKLQGLILIFIYFLLILSGCGRAGDQTLDDAEGGSPLGMKYVGGNNQVGFAGFMLPNELAVKTYAGTAGLPSFTIRYSEVTATGASIINPVTTTGSDGFARTRILPSAFVADKIRIKAEIIQGDVGSFGNAFQPIFFDLEAKQGAHHIEFVQGNNQTVTVNQPAPINPTIRVVDANGDTVADWPVTFTVTSGGGSTTSTLLTDSSGLASVIWTMGTNSDLANQLRVTATTISLPNTLNFDADATPDVPASISIAGGSTSITAGNCSAQYTFQFRDQFNNIAPAQSSTTVNLTDSASGVFYSDSSCTGGNEITSIIVPIGNSDASFYYRSTLAGSFTISADDVGAITAGTSAITVNPAPADHLALSAGNGQTQVVNNYLTTPPRVKVEDQFGNGVTGTAVNWTVLTGGGSVDSPSVTSGAGGLTSVPYRLGTIAGTNTLKAENLALPGTPKTINFSQTGIADSPTQMELTGLATITAGECPSAYTATLRDQYGNTALATANTTLNLSGQGDGVFYSDASCTGGNEITSITVANGNPTQNFYYRNTLAEVVNLAINDGGALTDDSYAVTVNPDVPFKIILTGPTPITTGTCTNQYTTTLQDQFSNVTNAIANTVINLTGKGNGEFYSDSVCTGGNEISSITVTTGSSNNRFYFKDPIAESLTFTADDAGALVASNLSVYSDNGAPIDNTANVQFTNAYSNSGNNIAVTWLAFTDDDLSDHRLYTYTNDTCTTGEVDHGLTGATTNSNNTIIDGLSDGVYYARVRAIDGFGNTTLSACSSDFITVDLTNPTDNGSNPQFTDVYDTDGNLIDVSWTAFTDANLLDYQLYTYTAAGCASGEVSHGRTGNTNVTNTALINGLTDGTYYLRVRAHDAATNSTLGDCSTDVLIVDLTNPTNPVVNNPPAGTTVPNLSVSWTNSTDTNFDTHNVKACTNNDCATGCVGEKTSVSTPTTLTLVMNNTYYICVQGQDLAGRTSPWVPSATTVLAKNHPPILVAIADQTGAAENSAITTINAEDTSGGDTDQDGETITYACTYDTTVNGSVSSGTSCTSLTGVSFNTTTGVMDWTPNYDQAGNYEFKIIGTSFDNLSDDEIFVINVANTDRPPVIRTIDDQGSAAENTAITTIDATDDNTSNDTDIDGDVLSYTCVYDTAIDSAVAGSTLCTTITGLSFDISTGIMNWTPGFFQAGSYEFKITATGGPDNLSDTEIFSITVANTDRPPVIAAISDQSVNEAANISIDPSDTSGGDTDIDNETITYSCVFDKINDGAVGAGTACTSLTGTATFDTGTGVLSWTPDYFATQNGPDYEIKITATSGPDTLTDDEIYVITVNNVDRAPVLATISDQPGAAENSAITTINANDTSGGDTDIDNDVLTYSCYYDTAIDGSVTNTTLCSTLTSLSFSTSTGVMDWTPNYTQAGSYEFKITGTGGPDTLSDDEIFSITVANTDRPPVLSAIADQAGASEGTAITTVNAQDNNTSTDNDIDGEAITYTCEFDNTTSGTIISGANCSTLPGTVSFNSSTGVLDWTPGYFAAQTSATWEIRINGTSGPDTLSDDEFFVITVANTDRSPDISPIGNQTVAENAAITQINADDTSGGDTDIDNDVLTYSCQFDTTVSGTIVSGADCSTLSGTVSFNTTTGVLDWTPGFFAFQNGPQYEIEITATGGPDTLSDTEFLVITTTNTDRPPVLAAIGNQTIAEAQAMTQVNANDANSGNDNDIDNEAISYSCVYDTTIDTAVAATTNCTSLTGVSFNTSTGVMDWTPGYFQAGSYEFKITGTVNALSDDEIFSINVNNTDRPPIINTINDFSVAENAAITPVNASDANTNNDNDIDNEAITYACVFDQVNDGAVAAGTACTSLTGSATFNTTTGVLTWTPDYFATQNGPDYEIKITATSGPDTLTDDEIFVITVTNSDRPPVIATISDQAGAAEGTAITQVNADDTSGGDTDIDNDVLTYACVFDNSSDSAVSGGTNCTSLPGTATFNTGTGVLDWTPGYFTAQTSNTWEIKITATSGPDTLSDDEIFVITVANTDRAPVITAIGDQTIAEASAMGQVNAEDTSGGDTDVDNETITYSCVYDTAIDSAVAGSTQCTSLSGISFDTSTGVMDWTPGYFQAGDYEFKITATVNALSDDEIFSVTVNNTDRPPSLNTITDLSVAENAAMASVNASDSNTSNDNDIDGEAITYSCLFDTTVSASIVSGSACTTLPGTATFDTSTGVLDWTPNFTSAGSYEVQITATSGPDTLTDAEIFVITVTNTDRAPLIAAIGNETVNENVAITQVNANDNNTGNDTDIDGDTLTYSCQYDNTVSSTIVSGLNCSSLPGAVTFNSSTGVLDWTPDFTANQNGPQYEIEVTATGGPDTLSDTEFFVITVNNVDRAPVIATIADFGANEDTAITPVNANDDNTGNDTDIDGDTLTYSCQYDTTVSTSIVSGSNCTSLPGSVTFNTSTGVLSWTPDFSATQSGPAYEIEITATGGPDTLSDTEIFVITVANTDRSPVIATISNETVNENSAITQVNADDTSGGDTDIDGDTLTYACVYDTTVSGSIVAGTTCSSLPGTASFNTTTGVLDWTPSFTASLLGPNYEIQITATGGPDTLSDTEIFVITVNNVDRPPVLTAIGNQTIAENSMMTQVDANDDNTGNDTDIDGDTITYTCVYDTTINSSVLSSNPCTDLTGVSFNTSTGVMDWTPNYSQAGNYEFKITGTSQSLSDEEIFSVVVNNTDRAPVIATVADFGATENVAITPVNANDDNTGNDTDIDGDTLTYSCQYDTTVSTTIVSGSNCSSLPGSATFNTTTGVLAWTPSFSATQSGPDYEIEITATGGPDTLTDTEIFVITVANNDRAPVIATITDQTINENVAMTQVNADDTSGGDTDIDGDTLSYACVYDTSIDSSVAGSAACTSIAGVTFNTTTGVMDWTPGFTQAGSYEFKITATGGPDTLSDDEVFSVTVNNVDRAPVIAAIGNQTLNENVAITQVNADDTSGGDTDIDGDVLTYTCVYDTTIDTSVAGSTACTSITGVTFNTTTGVIDWTPSYSQAGTFEFKITATGGPDTLSDDELFSITVNNVDRAPVIAAIGNQTVNENVAISAVDANDDNTGNDTDIDGDTLTYSCQYDTTVSSTIVSGTACTSLPGSASFNTTTGAFTWTPDYTAAANAAYEIEITATGGPDTLSDTEFFVININNVDRAPVIAAIGNQTLNENAAITQVNADDTSGGDTDIDGDTLTYACVYDTTIDSSVAGSTLCSSITGVTFNTTNGVMDWTPSFSQAGDYEFKVTATGGPDTLSDDELFSITVNNIDRAPVIAAIGDESVNENVAITQVNADDTSGGDTDIDGDTLTYSCQYDTTVSTSIVSGSNCSALPGAVSFNASTGVLDWTPDYTAAANSTYEIEITATGGPDTLSDTEFLVITVNNVDRAPVIAAIGDQTVSENSAISQVDANDTSGGDTDIDGDTLTYSCQYDNISNGSIASGTTCTSLPGTATFNSSTGVLDWTPDYTAAANSTYEVEITATGGPDTLSDTELFVITVNNVDRAPVIAAIGNETVNENVAITQVNADDTSGGDTDIDGDTLTYSCQYDTTISTSIVSGSACTSLPGTATFDTSTGVLDWTPDYSAAANSTYEIEITATGGPDTLSDTEFLVITVNNVDRAPLLTAIADQAGAAENSAITTVNANDNNTGNDTDIDGDTITYACTYDNTEDAAVAAGTACTSLPGAASFNTATGVLDWTPDYSASATPKYEVKIVATAGPDTLSDDEIFVVTVANTDRPPVLATIADQPGVTETTPISTINAADTSGGDTDIDGDAISYACTYDLVVDNAVATGSACTDLGATFSTITGILDWTPSIVQAGVYEFKIVGTASALSDDEIFVITVGNTDQPPVLAAIGNQTVSENSAIAAINADDTSGGDTDVDGDAITYSCTYDTSIDGAVGSGANCSTLTGISFSPTFGTFTWTPNYDQAGPYEFKIVGTASPLSDDEIFTVTVNNTDRPPVLAAISDETVSENSAITQVNANDTSGGDTDVDGDTITYACVYDTTVDSAVAGSTACTTLSGVTFNTTTGVMDWTPSYTQAGNYEFKITGTANALSDDDIFAITVTNTDRAPVIAAIGNETVNENAAITQINADDTSGGDTDIDGDTITYSCLYDTTVSGGIVSGTACSSLPGTPSFNAASGVLDWTPNYSAAGSYEIEITGTASALSDSEIFVITVNNVDRPPVLAAIGNETVSENTAITQVNADDTSGGDTDVDGDSITYSCSFDNTANGSISGGSNCSTLPGAVSFNSTTGVLDWIPNYDASTTPTYEIEITGSANALSDTEILVITVNNTDRPPVLATISDETVNENVSISAINASDTSGGDTDVDGDTITYACVYDTTIDTAVAASTACTTLTGVSFNTTTGEMAWTPSFTQAGNYEFKVTGTANALSDDEIFVITVNNVDRAPVLATISDETVSENSAITQVNANDTSGGDTDVDGDTITYACVYDTTVDMAVAGSTTCTSLTGVSFNTTTGVMDWTPNYSQAGSYEFKITGTAGALNDDEIYAITVNNTDRPPALAAISDETIAENTAITQVNADDTSGGDTDVDGDTITYTCVYDTAIDSAVAGSTACTTLTGVSFNATTGVMDWTPNYSQAGSYEFKITGAANALSDDDIFAITVSNTDRAPTLAAIANQTVNENTATTTINANDNSTGNDTDPDGDTITYTCTYDTTVDSAVAAGSNCSTLSGVSFTGATGVFDWTTTYDQAGTYEFKIVGSEGDLSDDEIFVITVNNVDRAPVLATISDETVSENSAITQVNANDTSGGDTDVDGDTITYACVYDTTVDMAVAGSTTCTSLTGVSFNTTTGVMDWTPNYSQAGSYEFKITGTAGALNDDEIYAITVNNTDRPPALAAISDETIAENTAITQVNADDTSGGDTDVDGDTITYTCVYDTAIDSAVAGSTACTTLTGVSFNATTGVMDWTPNYSQAGSYEFKITGAANALSDDDIFAITVSNTDRAPTLAAIANQTVNENTATTTINANDNSTGNDTDPDGDTITYTCTYDTTVDSAVAAGSNCSTLSGVSFTDATGVFDWTTTYDQAGTYEFKIVGSEGDLSDDEIFTVTVNNVDRAPVLVAIGNQTVSENAAITQVDAADTSGADTDADGDTISYTCFYDTSIDGSVSSTNACATLTGVSFTAGTGVMDWTPNYSQAGTYEFKIVGSEGDLSDDEIYTVTVNNTDRPPTLATIADETVSENSTITAIDAADLSGGDTDPDGDAITYTCTFDTTIDSAVAAGASCSTLAGVSFNGTSGAMTWTPNYSQAGTYEFKIVGSEGDLSDDEIFAITVTNTDRPPVLATISDETVSENAAITQVNGADTSGGDTDVDGDTITYACVYDTTIDTAVAGSTACTSLTGVSFNTTTGVMDWTPNYSQAGNYEFKITGTAGALSDDEIFAITVNNTDRPPVLVAISDETVAENAAITQVNANDTSGGDTDVDGDTITYACVYDTTIDTAVAGSTSCTSLTGVSFNTTTGVMDWTPNYSQAGSYEFKITGSAGALSDDDIFAITVNNTDRAPVLATISDTAINENTALTTINAADTSGGDTDADGDTITYTCYYDTTNDGAVATTNACTTLSGVSFTGATGVLDWTPSFTQAGTYEFRIIGDEGDLTDDEIFVVTVNNVDRPPVLATVSDETVSENAAITQVNAADTSGGDTDIDGDTISYACVYDTSIDTSVAGSTACTSLTGVSFNTTTGVMDWTPSFTQAGSYEFKITGTANALSDDEIFAITVNNTDRAPVIAAIGDESVAELVAITQVNANDDNTGNDTDIDGDTITYSCLYDTTVSGGIVSGTACTSLPGTVSFNATTGVLDWTPNTSAAATYEVEITGSAGALSDGEIFILTITNANQPPVLAAIGDETVNEGVAITQVNANDNNTGNDTDSDGDTITYSCLYDTTVSGGIVSGTACTSLPGTPAFNTTTGVLDWTPDFSASGSYEIEITGTANAQSDGEIFVITVNNVDQAPELAAIGDETVSENSAITQVNADDTSGGDTDFDGDTITYSCLFDTSISGSIVSGTACTSLAGAVSFNTTTGVLDWTPDFTAAGSYEIEITGSEGDLSDGEIFVITVNNTDRAPVLATISDQGAAAENSAITTINANDNSTGNDTDADGDTISYTCYYDTSSDGSVATTNACTTLTGVSFTGATGVMDWTPNYSQAGTYEFRIIGDEGDLSDDEIFVITVANTDRAPVLAAIGDETVSENNAITQVNAADTSGGDTDADGDTITYSCLYDTTVSGGIVSGTACASLPGSASFNATTGVLDWTPDYTAAATYEIEITGTANALSDGEIFVITVNNSDRAPVLAAIGDETVSENSPITQVNAADTSGGDTDVDGDTITYSCLYDTTVSGAIASGTACASLPGTATFNTTTGVLDWTPDFTAAGSYEIEITGTANALSDGEILVITVNNTDRAPTLATIGDQTTTEGVAITQVNANDNTTGNDTDPDGDTITYSCLYDTTVSGGIVSGTACTTLPGTATFNTTTGVLDWTPNTSSAGTYEVEITGSEGDLSDTELFVLTVNNTNQAPVLAAIGDETVNENVAITQVNANDTSGGDTDVDGQTLTYSCLYDTTVSGAIASGTSCASLPGTATFNTTTGVLDWTPDFTAAGSYEIEITGSDGALSDGEIFVITVNNVDRAPTLAAIGDETVSENTAITQVNANDTSGGDTDPDGDTITYSCLYDTTVSGGIVSGTACTSLPGTVSFNTGTGVLDWTPDYTAAATYEVEITGSEGDLSDGEIFVITVNNIDRPPVLAAIGDQGGASENTAISTVNANDTSGGDTDVDGDTITYSCLYDTTISGAIVSGTACTSLPGTATFNTTTGVLDWTPSYTAVGDYEFEITGTANALSDGEIFTVTVANTDRAPVIAAIGDSGATENVSITAIDANDTSGGDTDVDGDTITYACVFDTTVDAAVGAGTACTSLPGTATFDTGTGVLNWTPNFTAASAPDYEIKVTATANALTDDEIYVITVANVDRAPILATVGDETVNEGVAITQVNANDNNTSNDTDIDGDTISYSCVFDNTNDGAVAAGTACSSLPGTVSFASGTGVLDWTPDFTTNDTSPTWEVKITGTAGSLSDDEIFVITVNNADQPPVLVAIADQAGAAENTAIATVNADDTSGGDTDADGDTITYSCLYDTTVSGGITGGTACSSLPGTASFNTGTGVFDWTPSYTAAGTYEIEITGTANALSDGEIFVITVANTDRLPVLATIADQAGAVEGSAITAIDANENSTGNDTDLDGETITYTCYYDNTNDTAVTNTNLCSGLAGATFNTGTGVFAWTPDYSTNDTSATWEFKITGTANAASDDEFFVVTVANTDRAPVLAVIADENVTPGNAITQINANDLNTSTDTDIDGDTITYACVYDQVNDGAVAAGSACTGLTGLTFNTATGVMNWTTQAGDAGDYEFKITGTAGALSDDEIFVIGVLSPVLTWTDSGANVVTEAAPYDFTPGGPNSGTATETFTLTNSGNQASGAITIAFQGNPKHFTIIVDNCAGGVDHPSGGGSTTCTVQIEWDGSSKPNNRVNSATVNVTPTNGATANFGVQGEN